MSAAAAIPLVNGFGVEWFKACIDITLWPKSAQRAYAFLKRRTRQRKREFRCKDREIGHETGEMSNRAPYHRRTVQRGLKWLEDHGIIERDWSDGSGRVIRILLPLAGDGKEEAEKPKAAEAPGPAPTPTSTPRPTPTPDPEPEPADAGPADWAELRRQIAETKAADATAKAEAKAAVVPAAGPIGVGAAEEAARKLTDDEFRRLEREAAGGFITSGDRKILEAARRIRSP